MKHNSTTRYTIKKYSRDRAKQLNVLIKPSSNPAKKIDVFNKSGKRLASIGAKGMNDYPTYIQNHGLKYAKTRRKLYKQRHEKDRHIKGTPGYFADKILW
jgi:hypothetical protein